MFVCSFDIGFVERVCCGVSLRMCRCRCKPEFGVYVRICVQYACDVCAWFCLCVFAAFV